MGSQASLEELRGEAWFPAGIAQSVEPAASQVPEGFESWRLHTRFDSVMMFLPTGDVESIDWWKRVIPVGGGGKRWGDPPNVEGGKIKKIPRHNVSGGLEFLLTEKSGRKVVIRLLMLDEKGHGRTLSELGSEHLNSAFGGLQVAKRDLLLFFRQDEGQRADELLSAALRDSDIDEGVKICNRVGQVLGRFHIDSLNKKSLPNDERKWNARLKSLEDRVLSNTLWRAPHSRDTMATITHQNFGLEAVQIDGDEAIISLCDDGVPNAVLPPSRDFPAVRDLAAAYRSLANICAKMASESRVEGEVELSLRKALFEGWNSTAPESATSSRALDGHKGGVAIWEYEQVLEEAAISQAWDRPVEQRTKWWLGHVSRIQAEMYRSKSLSAISLMAGVAAFFVPLMEQWMPSFSDRLLLAAALAGVAVGLRLLYRRRAPPPY
jgi:hypothetical protein